MLCNCNSNYYVGKKTHECKVWWGQFFFGGIVIGFVAFILLNSWVNRDVPYVLTLGEQLKIVVDDIDRKKGSDLTSLDIVAKVSADKPEDIGVERAMWWQALSLLVLIMNPIQRNFGSITPFSAVVKLQLVDYWK